MGYDNYLNDLQISSDSVILLGWIYSLFKIYSRKFWWFRKSYRAFEVFRNSTFKTKYQKSNLTLSTIHSVKGLEFDCVFVVDIVDAIAIPSNQSDELDSEEERRLFYVAMTRAKESLFLLAPKTHNSQPVMSSPFIDLNFKILRRCILWKWI